MKKLSVNSPEYRNLVSKLLGKEVKFGDLPAVAIPEVKSFVKVERNVKGLTGVKDLDLKILSEVNDRDLFSFCLVNKQINQICKDEHFWRNRFLSRFGQFKKPTNVSWRKQYLITVSILEYQKELISIMQENLSPDFISGDLSRLDYLHRKISSLNDSLEKIIYQTELLSLMERNLSPDFDSSKMRYLQSKLSSLNEDEEDDYGSEEILLG